ncbi:hypothetical protein [Streptomyces sp. NPDC054975]
MSKGLSAAEVVDAVTAFTSDVMVNFLGTILAAGTGSWFAARTSCGPRGNDVGGRYGLLPISPHEGEGHCSERKGPLSGAIRALRKGSSIPFLP